MQHHRLLSYYKRITPYFLTFCVFNNILEFPLHFTNELIYSVLRKRAFVITFIKYEYVKL